MWQSIKNIFYLGVKELRGLLGDRMLMLLILYSFTLQLYTVGTSSADAVSEASVAIVDNDNSQLTKRMTDALVPPYFLPPRQMSASEIDAAMDRGEVTFVVVFPPNFQRDVQAGNTAEIQLNVDATRMSQAFVGAGYIEQIFMQEYQEFMGKGAEIKPLASLIQRNRFNPNLTSSWFEVIMQLANSVTMFAIILTGAALIRERERGTLEHLMVMPVTPFQIMASKIWSMSLVVLVSTGLAMALVVKWWLNIPTLGSPWIFMLGVLLHLFAMTSMGIFLACIANSMPQLGMLMILVLMPLQMLSGGSTPVESMPVALQHIMKIAPTTHFNSISKAVLFRGADLQAVWPEMLALFIIGGLLYCYSLGRFKKSL